MIPPSSVARLFLTDRYVLSINCTNSNLEFVTNCWTCIQFSYLYSVSQSENNLPSKMFDPIIIIIMDKIAIHSIVLATSTIVRVQLGIKI